MPTDCIFCKIINKDIPAKFIHDDTICAAFPDIRPKARVHYLIVSKKHIPSIADLEEGDERIIGHMVKVGKKIAHSEKLGGYKLSFNVGKEGGQEVFHVHLHLMAN